MNTDSLKRLWKRVFCDSDSFINAFFDIAYSPDRCRCIVENGETVSALYWFDCEYEGGKLAYIYAVATAPDRRGQGLASRLLEQTHAHLKALGYAGTVLKPADGLIPFYERLDYKVSSYVSSFDAEAGAVPAVLRPLSTEEYAALRRKYLPEYAVVQEGLTLEFLSTFAQFYAVEGALICSAKDGPIIFEYLGNPAFSPGILAAFGIKEAKMRTIGTDTPFAMFHPLNCTKMPGYLGITLE